MKICKDCGKVVNNISIRCKSCSNRNRKGKYHYIGTKRSKQARENISKAKLGEKNPAWKGDNVGYKQLHIWINKHKPKSMFCEMCGKITEKLDASSINHSYERDISKWRWLCKSCHGKERRKKIKW